MRNAAAATAPPGGHTADRPAQDAASAASQCPLRVRPRLIFFFLLFREKAEIGLVHSKFQARWILRHSDAAAPWSSDWLHRWEGRGLLPASQGNVSEVFGVTLAHGSG